MFEDILGNQEIYDERKPFPPAKKGDLARTGEPVGFVKNDQGKPLMSDPDDDEELILELEDDDPCEDCQDDCDCGGNCSNPQPKDPDIWSTKGA